MALEVIVSKASVLKLNDDDYQVTINVLILNELQETILEKDYSERYYSAITVDSIKLKLQNQILEDWNKLVSEKTIFDAVAFNTMVAEIQDAASNYINQ